MTKQIYNVDEALQYIKENEFDEYKMDYKGFMLKIKRHPTLKNLNGYLKINDNCDTNLAEKVCNEVFHGGVTYHKDGVLGFDCSHMTDLVLIPPMSFYNFEGASYKTVEFVKQNLIEAANLILKREDETDEN